MSKEQTPITAWEFYENSDTANVYDVMEQYAQYREKKAVLEALEKEVIKACMKYNATAIFNKKLAKEYYETEVKPRYKTEN
jgi:hypothetical protein